MTKQCLSRLKVIGLFIIKTKNMKKVIIVLVIALMSQTMATRAAGITVPSAVTTAFTTRFPSGRLKKWKQYPQGYVAVFRQKGKKEFAYFAADGAWKGTETPIGWSWNLPDTVKKAWRKCEYSAWKIEHIKMIEQPDQPLYVLDVNNSPLLDADHSYIDGEEWVIFFNRKGELVRKYQVN